MRFMFANTSATQQLSFDVKDNFKEFQTDFGYKKKETELKQVSKSFCNWMN